MLLTRLMSTQHASTAPYYQLKQRLRITQSLWVIIPGAAPSHGQSREQTAITEIRGGAGNGPASQWTDVRGQNPPSLVLWGTQWEQNMLRMLVENKWWGNVWLCGSGLVISGYIFSLVMSPFWPLIPITPGTLSHPNHLYIALDKTIG